MRQIFTKVLILVASIMLSACAADNPEQADYEVEKFHSLYNAGKFDRIYKSTTPDFKAFASEFQFTIVLQKLTDRLGDHQSSTLTDWTSGSTPRGGRLITLTYQAEYEKDPKAQESFSYIIQGDTAQLANFNVVSEKLKRKN